MCHNLIHQFVAVAPNMSTFSCMWSLCISRSLIHVCLINVGSMGLFANLNCEMLFQIFLRLEPKWVFRCGSVCKNWHSGVSDATFLQLRYQSQQQCPLLLRMGDDKFPYFWMDALDLHTLKNHDFSMVSGSNCPRDQWVNCFKIHGSCNGVLLLSFREDLYFSNPITRHWSRFAYTTHNNQSMLCLYHHKESGCFRILKE